MGANILYSDGSSKHASPDSEETTESAKVQRAQKTKTRTLSHENKNELAESRKISERRFSTGTKLAKHMAQEQYRTQALLSMAESAKCKNDALEERNAIEAFSQPVHWHYSKQLSSLVRFAKFISPKCGSELDYMLNQRTRPSTIAHSARTGRSEIKMRRVSLQRAVKIPVVLC